MSFTAAGEVEITGLTYDSRKVEAGNCFFAVRGTQSDGHNFIPKAIEAGAAVIVCEQLPEQLNPAVSYVVVKDTNAAMADIAAAYYDNPSHDARTPLRTPPCECSQHEGAVFPCIVRKKTQVPNTARCLFCLG